MNVPHVLAQARFKDTAIWSPRSQYGSCQVCQLLYVLHCRGTLNLLLSSWLYSSPASSLLLFLSLPCSLPLSALLSPSLSPALSLSPAPSLSPALSLSCSLSLPLSPVSLNQDIACPFLFIAASLAPSRMLCSPICFSFHFFALSGSLSLSPPPLPTSLPLSFFSLSAAWLSLTTHNIRSETRTWIYRISLRFFC